MIIGRELSKFLTAVTSFELKQMCKGRCPRRIRRARREGPEEKWGRLVRKIKRLKRLHLIRGQVIQFLQSFACISEQSWSRYEKCSPERRQLLAEASAEDSSSVVVGPWSPEEYLAEKYATKFRKHHLQTKNTLDRKSR